MLNFFQSKPKGGEGSSSRSRGSSSRSFNNSPYPSYIPPLPPSSSSSRGLFRPLTPPPDFPVYQHEEEEDRNRFIPYPSPPTRGHSESSNPPAYDDMLSSDYTSSVLLAQKLYEEERQLEKDWELALKLNEVDQVDDTFQHPTTPVSPVGRVPPVGRASPAGRASETKGKSREVIENLECGICFEKFRVVKDPYASSFDPQFYKWGVLLGMRLSGCPHAYCVVCLMQHIDAKLNNPERSNVFPITCPECGKDGVPIQDKTAKRILGPENMAVWYHRQLLETQNQVFCPNAKCSVPISLDQGQINGECPMCKKNYCYICRVDWHDGYTCEQFKSLPPREADDDSRFWNMASGTSWKRCPRCKMIVEKISGCNHIRCRCGHDWYYDKEKLQPI